MKAVVALARKVGPTELPVLITGETGSGKEVVAEMIHASSPRREREMVCINCAGLPRELVESELFGSIRGSYTGSSGTRTGLLASADTSTVFLDELSEMPLDLQSKLLRFLQNKKVRKVGDTGEAVVDVRIIAAISKPPEVCIRELRLRDDLYYRLSAIVIPVPPLWERKPDIVPLALTYLDHFSGQFKRTPPVMSSDVADRLKHYTWPGNVRELQNEMARCALLCGESILMSDLSPALFAFTEKLTSLLQGCNGLSDLEMAEAKVIALALLKHDFNVKKCAAVLGIGRATIYVKLQKYKITTREEAERFGEPIPNRNGHVIPVTGTAAGLVRRPRVRRGV